MKSISKKIIIYLCIGFLTFSSVSITYYRSVHAIEWIEVGISTAEAIKWLLGALGIIATGTALGANFWDGYEDEFYEYVDENADIPGPDVRAWLEKLGKGTLDKGSSCWTAFKFWASSIASDIVNNGSGGSGSLSVPSTASDIITYFCNLNNLPINNISSSVDQFSTNYAAYITYNDFWSIYLLPSNKTYIYNNGYLESTDHQYFESKQIWDRYNTGNWSFNGGSGFVDGKGYVYFGTQGYVWNISGSLPANVSVLGESVATESPFDSIDYSQQNLLDLISSLNPDADSNEVAIPMPGVSSGDDTISTDVYDNIIDKVNTGEISLVQGIEDIQDLLKVVVYDTTTDEVIPLSPDPDDPSKNETKEDAIEDAKSNMGFTLAGLETVFPFCIPWDLFAFMNLLKADPQIPVFNVPFPNVEDPAHPVFVVVDLTPWDGFMRFLRLGMDLLFIVGLAVATRSLIGAGGD